MLSSSPAYAVPFVVDRADAPRLYHLVNVGLEPVGGLTLTHLGNGYCPPQRVNRLEPGGRMSIAVFGADPEDTGVVIV